MSCQHTVQMYTSIRCIPHGEGVLDRVPHVHIYPIYPMDLGGDGKFTNGKRKK